MDAFLGVDVGTTQTKVVALAEDGRRQVARAPTPVDRDAGGPVHDPDAVVALVAELARAAVGALDGCRVRAVCTASVGEEGVAIGADGRPLYPALAWYARRTSATGERFRREHDAAATYAACGLPQDPIHTLFHWAWLNDHAPEVLRAARAWLSLSEYVAYALSGARAMSPSQASRTHLWSPFGDGWQEEWARAVGGDAALLPPVVPAGTVLGPLRPDALPGVAAAPDAAVVMGGHDHSMGAWMAGVRSPGEVLDSLGTAESVYVIASPGVKPTEAGRAAALQHGAAVSAGGPGRHHVLGALHSGAGTAAMARLLGGDIEALEREAEAVPAGAGGLRYEPPPWGEDPRGTFRAVPLEATAGEWFRAVLEGWARAAVQAVAAVAAEGRSEVRRVRAIGGGSRVALALVIRASMLPCPLEVVTEPELVALGAATMAMGAVRPDVPPPDVAVVPVPPHPAWARAYRQMDPGTVRDIPGGLRAGEERMSAGPHGPSGPRIRRFPPA
jgi:xylulokinase